MMDNKDRNWAKYGMHVVNAQLNRRPSRVKADYSPNQIFYGKRHDKLSLYNILGRDIVKCAETEAGLEAAYKAVCESTNTHSTEDLLRIIRAADREFLQELRDNGEDLEESEKLLLLSEDDDPEEQKVGDDTVGKEQENASDSDKDGDPDINEDDDMEKDEENEQNVDDDMEKDKEMGQNVDSDDMENDQEKASDSQEVSILIPMKNTRLMMVMIWMLIMRTQVKATETEILIPLITNMETLLHEVLSGVKSSRAVLHKPSR
jgi:hypothetical protein